MTAIKVISRIHLKWKLLIWSKILAGGLGMLALAYMSFASHISIGFQGLLVVTSFAISFILFREQIPSLSDAEALINAQLPELEYSVSLVDQAPTTDLARLQQYKVIQLLSQKTSEIAYPVTLKDLVILFLVTATLGFGAVWMSDLKEESSAAKEVLLPKSSEAVSLQKTPISFTSQIRIDAPNYTNLKTRYQRQLDLEKVIVGSKVIWQLSFNRKPKTAWIKLSSGDSIPFQSGEDFKASLTAEKRGFYTLNFIDHRGKTHLSDYHKLDVIPDNPPEVEIVDIPQYQSIYPGEANGTTFTATATDDYGLSEAYIVATITKGSGESVKFREEKIPFLKEVGGKQFGERMTFTLDQFEMEPGNELYFYLEAWDNQQPPKANRTETYFFILEDTAEIAFSLEGDLGIDLMPEYFRSQRQIIIDSEKLLKEKASISKEEFNQRSNELGFDQKALRLKYGQFIGEEADSGLDIENEVEEEPQAQQPGQVDVLSEFGHDHDHENEEGQMMDKGTEQQEDPVEELSHSHDDTETATFLEESMKSKLRAALTEMWDAELYLRLFKPEESLPYQYKALKLIKEIKNHARIYVHRMGFDAPPINEAESRLSGELEEVHGESFRSTYDYQETLPETKALIAAISNLMTQELPVSNTIQDQLQQTGNEIAGLAITEPGKYLKLLSTIRDISDQEQLQKNELDALKSKLVLIVPKATMPPKLESQPSHELLEEFIKELTRSKP
ncbi:hypothetical protein [Marinoscillum sp.]|uniref:hypothetical protein n=1 Tax=Marinoscillum sp. TaxID=2024838 RepID=UPI003BABA60E